MSRAYIGTSGWQYDHWKGPFYPEDISNEEMLAKYLETFDTVEVNNSFYQLPDEKTIESWLETAPKKFTFSMKASRYITHMKKLKDPEEAIGRFFERADRVGDRLGPILFQLPPNWRCNPDRLNDFLDQLPSKHRYTFEFRDTDWFQDEIYEALRENNAAFCIYELAGTESPKEITADFVYIRLHGPGDAYQGQYDGQTLGGWCGAINAWVKKGLDVYCYFDNDQNGYAAQDAARLKEMVEG